MERKQAVTEADSDAEWVVFLASGGVAGAGNEGSLVRGCEGSVWDVCSGKVKAKFVSIYAGVRLAVSVTHRYLTNL